MADEIQFFFVSRLQYDQSAEDIGLIEPCLQSVKNTLHVHQVTEGSAMGEVKWRRTSCNCEGCLSNSTTCTYTTASVVEPLPTGRPKRKLQGQLFTTCCSCVDRIICSCLDHVPRTVKNEANSESSDDDIPLCRPLIHVSPSSGSDESDAYVEVDTNHPSDADDFHSSMLKCVVQVMRWRDTRAHRPAICMRNRCTRYVQFNEQPLLVEASTILDRSLSHTYAHSAIMVSM